MLLTLLNFCEDRTWTRAAIVLHIETERKKKADIFQTTFSNVEFRLKYQWSLFNQQYFSIGSDNGSALKRRQAIVWNNGVLGCRLIYVTKSRRSNLEVCMLHRVAINHRVTQGGSTESWDAWSDDTDDNHSSISEGLERIPGNNGADELTGSGWVEIEI